MPAFGMKMILQGSRRPTYNAQQQQHHNHQQQTIIPTINRNNAMGMGMINNIRNAKSGCSSCGK